MFCSGSAVKFRGIGHIVTSYVSAQCLCGAVIFGDGRRNQHVLLQCTNASFVFGVTVCASLAYLFHLATVSYTHLDVYKRQAFFLLALGLGKLMTLPIGGADMPVVISLYNAFTGLAVAFEGYVLGNEALIIAGTMVGAAGMLLTRLMAKAMNRKISNCLLYTSRCV